MVSDRVATSVHVLRSVLSSRSVPGVSCPRDASLATAAIHMPLPQLRASTFGFAMTPVGSQMRPSLLVTIMVFAGALVGSVSAAAHTPGPEPVAAVPTGWSYMAPVARFTIRRVPVAVPGRTAVTPAGPYPGHATPWVWAPARLISSGLVSGLPQLHLTRGVPVASTITAVPA